MNWFHRHNWELITSEMGRWRIAGGMATAVLYRCDCGRTKVEEMSGHWTTEELRGEA